MGVEDSDDHFLADELNQYGHDFVKSPSGNYVFGEIPADIAANIKRHAASILLRTGDKKSGQIHIERPERLGQLQDTGYASAEEAVDEIARDYDRIYKGEKGNLFLVRRGTKTRLSMSS